MENEIIYKLIVSNSYEDKMLGYYFLCEKYPEIKNFAKKASAISLPNKMFIEREDVLKILPDFPGLDFIYPIENWEKLII